MDFSRALSDEHMTAIHACLVRAYGEAAPVEPDAMAAMEAKLRTEGPDALTGPQRSSVLQTAWPGERLHPALLPCRAPAPHGRLVGALHGHCASRPGASQSEK